MLFISFLAVVIGNAVLVSVVSIMNGFQNEIRELLIRNKPHIIVSAPSNFTEQIKQALLALGLAPKLSFEIPVLILTAMGSSGAFALASEDNLDLNGHEASVSKSLAQSFGIKVGDSVKVYFPTTTLTPFGSLPKSQTFKIVSIFNEPREIEQQIKINIETATKLINPNYSNFEIRITNPLDATKEKDRINNIFLSRGIPASVTTWIEINEPLWNALQLEKTAYFVVLTLIIIVASFSILSTLVMFVLEKRKEMAIFVALGASTKSLQRIFISIGVWIGLSGTLTGLGLGYLICLGLDTYGFPLDERVFGISRLPIEFNIKNYLIVGFTSLVICFLSILYPIRKLAKLKSSLILRE